MKKNKYKAESIKQRRWSKSQKDFAADKFMDSANYALAGLVFAVLIENEIRPIVFFGIILYILGWIVSINLKRKIS